MRSYKEVLSIAPGSEVHSGRVKMLSPCKRSRWKQITYGREKTAPSYFTAWSPVRFWGQHVTCRPARLWHHYSSEFWNIPTARLDEN